MDITVMATFFQNQIPIDLLISTILITTLTFVQWYHFLREFQITISKSRFEVDTKEIHLQRFISNKN